MTDAKEIWEAIKSRFGGNDKSNKMQKYILKQQFKGFFISNSEGLHKGYDKFQSLLSQLEIHGAGVSTEDASQKFFRSLPSSWSQVSLIMRTKPGVDTLSFDDLYNNLRVFKFDVKGSTASSSNIRNVDEFDLEEMDLKWQVAMISTRLKKFYKKTGRKLQFDAKEPVGFDKTKVECFNCHNTGYYCSINLVLLIKVTAGDNENATNSPPVSPTPQAPHTLSTIKLSILKKGEYDIWAMKIEHYLGHTDYPIWEVIEKGNGPVQVSTDTNGQIRVLPLKIVEEILARERKKRVDTLSFDDLYNNLRVFESDVKVSTASSSSTQNVAFVSSDSTNSTNKVNTAYGVSTSSVHNLQKEGSSSHTHDLMYSLFANQSNGPQLDHEDLEQFDEFDLEDMDLKWQMSAKDKSGLGYENKIHKEALSYENEVLESVFNSWSSDLEDSSVNDRFANVEGMHAVPPLMTGIYMPPKSNFRIDESKFTYETLESVPKPVESKPKAVSKPKVWCDSFIIEEYESDSDDEYVFKASVKQEKPSCTFINTIKLVKTPRQTIKDQDTFSQNPKVPKRDWTGLMSKRLSLGYVYTRKACFVCGSFSHLIRDCDFHEKKMAKQVELNKIKNKTLKGKGIVDSECSRHMTRNKAYLVESQDFIGGLAAFGDTECLVLSPDFKLPDENQVLLRVPKQNNMYSFNLKNIVPSGRLACLITKATVDESSKWYRKLGHAEAVSTACYVLNKVLVTKPQNKTPYELISGKIPIISYIRPFGCHVTILNTFDHLGKFEEKSDDGFLVGYSLNSKAFRVYNLKTKRVKENLHINFLENKPNVAGKGPTWLFDLDYLTDSMNYQPVTTKNKANKTAGPKEANNSAGTQDTIHAENSKMEAEHVQEYCVLPLWSSYTLTIKSSEAKNGDEKLIRDTAKTLRKTFAKSTEHLLLQARAARANSTNNVNTSSTLVNTASTIVHTASITVNTASTPVNTDSPSRHITSFEDIYEVPNYGIFTSASYDDEGAVADFTNLKSTVNEELLQFKTQQVWILVDLPFGKKEEGIDYDEVFGPVARIESIGIFLAFASYMGFIVYQMDVKSAFLYGKVDCGFRIKCLFSPKLRSLGKKHVSKQGRKKATTGTNIKERTNYVVNEGRYTDKIKVTNAEAKGISVASETLNAATLTVNTVSIQPVLVLLKLLCSYWV
nr:ribonuclease H-like domain-containing protein [Tanacetum cinerariifolium]